MLYIGIFHFFLATSYIFVVTLSVISFKFMQGGKYMHFANLGFFSMSTLLFFIGDCYSSLHFIICMVMYFCFSC
jgi:hypothetical protein